MEENVIFGMNGTKAVGSTQPLCGNTCGNTKYPSEIPDFTLVIITLHSANYMSNDLYWYEKAYVYIAKASVKI